MSLMLPRSYSQPYKIKRTTRDVKTSDLAAQPDPQTGSPPEGMPKSDEKNRPEERLDPHMVESPVFEQDIHNPTNKQTEPSSLEFATEEPRPGYDDYGKELGKDARVWKTYVQEASRWDSDLVDGWNRSLDLILIFAALFSAISAAFVIESSKSLQPDPAETSAQTLFVISQTLFAIANNQPGSPLNFTAPETQDFVVPVSAVCVNALWFLSLSLSVAVSLVAMLAKDWARGYMAELTGQPYQQARKRQRRWDGLKEWKVPEVITFLPSLLHLALLLFAAGLTVYLWNIHLGAAIPVLVITIASVVAYGVSTMLPLLYEHCPYSTPLSKLVDILPKPTFLRHFIKWIQRARQSEEPVSRPESDGDLMDDLTSRALSWLIVNYEDTKSADIALQAIAGASAKLPVQPLLDSGAEGLLNQRILSCFNTRQTTGKMYLKGQGLVEAVLLYSRALVVPGMFHPDIYHEWYWHWLGGVFICLVDDDINSSYSSPNKAAFALAGISVTKNTGPNGLNPNAYIILTNHLLQLHLKDKITLEDSALSALLRAATHWPSFELAAGCTTDHIRLMMTLVQLLLTLDSRGRLQMHTLVGTALTAFACSKRNYSHWPQHSHSDEGSPSDQAHALAMQYEHSPPSADTHIDSLVVFGLLEFLIHHTEALDDDDLNTLVKAFDNYGPRPATIDIFGLPKLAFGSDYQYMINTLTPFLRSDSPGVYVYSEAIRAACLSAFNHSFFDGCFRTAGIYTLTLENLRSARSGLLKRTCCTLLTSNSLFDNEALIGGLRLHHNLIPLCLETLHGEDERVVPYIMTRLYTIIRLVASYTQSPADKTTILQALLSYKPFLNATQSSHAGSYNLTLETLEMACMEAWLPRLEEMVDRIPRHLDDSGITWRLAYGVRSGPQGESHPLYGRITNLEARCEQTRGDGAAGWS
ncbi:hypothetical protein FS749_003944 [Ceratobasidium sp. UAMH 11750]|nr:hypothetical protein FS749_003944 [Ceratobasidium sp. UAMH 11750]